MVSVIHHVCGWNILTPSIRFWGWGVRLADDYLSSQSTADFLLGDLGRMQQLLILTFSFNQVTLIQRVELRTTKILLSCFYHIWRNSSERLTSDKCWISTESSGERRDVGGLSQVDWWFNPSHFVISRFTYFDSHIWQTNFNKITRI